MPTLNLSRIPPGGFHFYPDGPNGVKLESHDKTTLIDKLFDYRLRNGLPTGSEDDDIDAYFCTKWPDSCNLEAQDYGHRAPRQPREALLYRVSRWVSGLIDRMPRGGFTLNSQAEVKRRAIICVTCPQNQKWTGKCGGCAGSTIALLSQIRKLQKSPEALLGCAALGWENKTAVYLPFEHLPISETQRESLPDYCWRK